MSSKRTAVQRQWMRTIERAVQHPGSMRAFCDDNDIRPHTLYGWLKRLKGLEPEWHKKIKAASDAKAEQPAGLVPITVKPAAPVGSIDESATIEVRLRSGHVLIVREVFAAERLAELLRQLDPTC